MKEREEVRSHETSGSGGGQEMWIELLNGNIIVNVGDLVDVVSARQGQRESVVGGGERVAERDGKRGTGNGIRDQDRASRSGRRRLIIHRAASRSAPPLLPCLSMIHPHPSLSPNPSLVSSSQPSAILA